ncbi:MAG: DUF1294 domain-containing protein [Bellilinea sp.]
MTIYYIALSFITLLLWGIDKYRAKMGQWRIPERALLTLVVIGGAFGALAGMFLFRHKIRKIQFWIMVIIACAVHAWIWASQSSLLAG